MLSLVTATEMLYAAEAETRDRELARRRLIRERRESDAERGAGLDLSRTSRARHAALRHRRSASAPTGTAAVRTTA